MDWQSFTPWTALAGGAAIGVAASILLAMNGRVAGISGVLGGLLVPAAGEVLWRALFVFGLLAGGALVVALDPASVEAAPRALPLVALAGVLVGVGTRIGNGCTSGHGVCGLSRFSVRSLAATVTFMTTGAVTATLVRVMGGAS